MATSDNQSWVDNPYIREAYSQALRNPYVDWSFKERLFTLMEDEWQDQQTMDVCV